MLRKISDLIHRLEAIIVKVLTAIVSVVFSVIWTILWLPVAVVYSFGKSYYPEKPRKSLLRRIFDNEGSFL